MTGQLEFRRKLSWRLNVATSEKRQRSMPWPADVIRNLDTDRYTTTSPHTSIPGSRTYDLTRLAYLFSGGRRFLNITVSPSPPSINPSVRPSIHLPIHLDLQVQTTGQTGDVPYGVQRCHHLSFLNSIFAALRYYVSTILFECAKLPWRLGGVGFCAPPFTPAAIITPST